MRSLPDPLQTPLPVEAHDTNASDPGRLSLTVIDVAESGPLFTTDSAGRDQGQSMISLHFVVSSSKAESGEAGDSLREA
jgi:hypothetical protein